MTIRWLHLSDVHECNRDGYHREAMYEAILAEVGKETPPDFVFLTGDLAFSGAASEYESLRSRLIDPLKRALPSDCPIFTVPGNHDVDRREVGKPRLWIVDKAEQLEFQKVGDDGRRKRRGALLPRFENYRAFDHSVSAWDQDWLDSPDGAVFHIKTVDKRKIAVIGINTAWLSQDDQDWGSLTAGRTMVENVLSKASAEKPDLILVLGHHPIGAMSGEAAWSDGDLIRTRLEQVSALYLHGHLHQSGNQRTGDPIQSALSIQAPSAFQAPPDNTQWRNGVMWGEVDLDAGMLIVKPKRWNNQFRAYVADTDAIDPRFDTGDGTYSLALPGQATVHPENTSLEQAALPIGWEVVDVETLRAKIQTRPSVKEMSDWFDGQFPRWEVALADGIRPRKSVEDATRRFESAHDAAPLPSVVLLSGAGGEGKSAGLLQVAAQLVLGDQNWTCIRRTASAATLPDNLLSNLERRPDHAWIVAIDDAENIGDLLPAALRSIQPRTDVHLILAARDADWSIHGLTNAMWNGVAAVSVVTLAGLDAEDAKRIAEGWVAYGDDAMGRLRGRTAEQAAQALLGHAQEQAARREEGALLGALLIAREGEDLRDRVIRLITPWGTTRGFGSRSLLEIYAMIAAMHAENQLYLSRSVLAFALGCDAADLDRGPLRVLRREAMVDGSETYVMTRHRRIAEAARDWLADTGQDFSDYYPLLAKAALRQYFRDRPKTHELARWSELPFHFLKKGKLHWPVAVGVSQALFEADPGEPRRLTAYASMLRDTEQPKEALKLMLREGRRFRGHRGVLCEWGVIAAEAGDRGLAAWLQGRSAADDNFAIDEKLPRLALAGLGLNFERLAEETGDDFFARARAACGRLGAALPHLEARDHAYFEKHIGAWDAGRERRVSADTDIELMRLAVIKGSFENDPANDDPLFYENFLGSAETFSFRMLRGLIATY